MYVPVTHRYNNEMDCSKLSKSDAITNLIQYVHKGSAAGAYRIEEGKILDNALAHFDDSVEEKPRLTTDEVDQSNVAADLLAQACRLANERKAGVYTIKDSACIFDLIQHIRACVEKEQSSSDTGSGGSSEVRTKSKGKARALPRLDEVSESDEDVTELVTSRRRKQ